ncbi:hypothetical protein [Ralstonia phage RSF1]|uniref:Uncharacterized protein n=1 Tax=Ralstonia phage RSF1 TaxID=1689679 RepID=A0A0K2QRF2_9CAUD|nr:hypothetical protein AVU11_gp144 [Ralstonia phage RSF1]BAS04936.2 hypothetical protein [Ralstonia phage RSF1]
MIYREAKVNTFNPALSEEVKQRFLYEFANLCTAAVRVNAGSVVEEEVGSEQAVNYYAMAYLMGWKWRQDILIEVAKGLGWPDPEFVDFVHDMVIRLGIIPYNPNEAQNLADFEVAMKGHISLTKAVRSGLFAFPAARQAYNAWCKALNRKHTPHVEQQLGLVERDRKKD